VTQALDILVVDDDELILEAIAWLLENLGHRISTVTSGPAALERLRQGLPVDLLVVDQNMPGLTGLETLEQARRLRPALPAFLATGYRDEALEAELAAYPLALVVHKPMRLADLQAAFHRLEILRMEGPGA